MPDFHAVDAQRNQILRALVGGHVPGDQLHFRKTLLHLADGFHHSRGMAMRGIQSQHVHLGASQFHGALEEVSSGADGRSRAQPALLVLRGLGEFEFFLDVLDGDQALQIEVLVNDQQLLDAMALQQALGLFERRADRHGHQIVLGHRRSDRLPEIFLEAQVAIGEDAHEERAARHRQAGNAIFVHDVQGLLHGMLGGDRDRIDDHSAFRALDAVDLFGLAINGHIAMDETQAALPGHGDGQMSLGDGVHGGGDHGNIQGDFASQAGARVGLGRQDRGFAGQQQHIVKRQTFEDRSFHSRVLPPETSPPDMAQPSGAGLLDV